METTNYIEEYHPVFKAVVDSTVEATEQHTVAPETHVSMPPLINAHCIIYYYNFEYKSAF